SGHFDYGIEEQLEKETSSKQMAVDVETTKVNLYKAPMELDIYGNQNKIQELPKPLTPHRKENDIVNSALMEIDPSKVSDESNMEINPIQKDEIIVPAKQILANQPTLPRIVTGSNAIKIINKRSFSSSGDNRDINSQKVISGRTRRESLKEQDREAPRVRFKAIKMSKENPDHKATSTTLWLNPQIFGSTVAVEKNRKHHRTVYLYNQATTENWENFKSVLDKKLQKEKTTLDKLSGPDNSKNGKGNFGRRSIWAQIYEPIKGIQNTWFKDLLSEITEE
ncbi:29944_t:CDS:2, partial [Gigaspora margarita]